MTTYHKLLGLLRPFWQRVAGAVMLSVATIGSSIGLLGLSAYLISHAALHPSIAELQTTIVGVRIFGILRGVFRYLERLVSHDVNFKLVAKLRVRVYDLLEPLTPAVLGRHQSSDLYSRIIRDVDSLDHFYVRVIAPMWTAIFVTVGMTLFLGLVFPFAWIPFVAGMLLSGLIIPIIAYWLGSVISPSIVSLHDEMTATAVTAIQGMAENIIFGGKNRCIDEWDRQCSTLSKLQIRSNILSASIDAVNNLLMNLTMAAILGLGALTVSSGALEAMSLPVLVVLVLASFEAVQPLGQAAQFLTGSKRAGERIFVLEKLKPAVAFPNQGDAPEPKSSLELQQVSFGYPDSNDDALSNITLEVKPGEKIAIIGPSGSGKTTIGRLILRYWDPLRGSLSFGPVPYQKLVEADLRGLISIVPQNPYVFANTLRTNLAFGNTSIADGELENLLNDVNLQDWYSNLPNGLNTWLGEHGSRMSGGERQRLCIARTILRRSPINVFDEPTSNLDAVNASLTRDLLFRRFQDSTQIWITHDLADLDKMDRIIVLDAGTVKEIGSSLEIKQKGGYYARLSEQFEKGSAF